MCNSQTLVLSAIQEPWVAEEGEPSDPAAAKAEVLSSICLQGGCRLGAGVCREVLPNATSMFMASDFRLWHLLAVF